MRQAANLWAVTSELWQHLLTKIEFDPRISIIDSLPVPVCRFARAYALWACRTFFEHADYGYDEMEKQTYYGLRAHARICWPGLIVGAVLTPANVHDLTAAEVLAERAQGWLLGDRNYWSPDLADLLAQQGIELGAPYISAKDESEPWPAWLKQVRRRIETVFSQLVGRYNAEKTWARDRWHLSSRWWRKLLSHTMSVLVGQRLGFESPLQFAKMITL